MEHFTICELMSIVEFAKYKQVTRQTIYRRIKEKKIKLILISGKKFIKPE